MFRFIKKVLVVAMKFFGSNVLNVNPLKCVLMNNQECKIRPQMMNISSNEPKCYRYNVKINRCSGIWNYINDSHAKLSVPDVVKNMPKVTNLVPRTNETRHKE